MKSAYIIVDDFMHPHYRLITTIRNMFDLNKWHICVLSGIESICMFKGAPDLIVNFKDGQENYRMNTRNWYETQFAYDIPGFVKNNGCGYIAIHSGLDHIPDSHPIYREVLQGKVFVDEGEPAFMNNMLFPTPGGMPYGCFDNVTYLKSEDHPVLNGITGFTIRDEQYRIVLLDGGTAKVVAKTTSRAGDSVGCFVNEVGNGRICGIAAGHLQEALESTPVTTLLKNAVSWCGQD